MEKEVYSHIGKVMRCYRKRIGLTQKKLAKETGLSEMSIGKYERGERKPKLEQIVKISCALGISPQGLVDGVDFDYLTNNNRPTIHENPLFVYLEYLGFYIENTEREDVFKFAIDNPPIEELVLLGSFYLNKSDIERIDNLVGDFTQKIVIAMGKESLNSFDDEE